MKIEFECPICKRLKRFSKNKYAGASYYSQELVETNIIEFHCVSLHSSITVIENEKFDLLFESGVRAISDYYFRESVTSAAASLERFYEFIIKIILDSDSINEKEIERSWKNVSSQSERQLGAYIFLYISKFKTSPPLLSNKMIQFRNKVIHKGYFPTKEESIEFLDNVYDVIKPVFRKLEQEMPNSLKNLRNKSLKERIDSGQKIIDKWKVDFPHLDVRPGINDTPKLNTFETFMNTLLNHKKDIEIRKYINSIENYA